MKRILELVSLVVLVSTLSSCSDSTKPGTGRITLILKPVVGGMDYRPGHFDFFNAAGQNYSIETLRFFVSRFAFSEGAGTGGFASAERFFIEPTDQSSLYENVITFGNVPSGKYTGMSFVFGLNEAQNVDGAFTGEIHDKMAWPSQLGGGYHYMKKEGKYIENGDTLSYATHTGRLHDKSHHITVVLDFPTGVTVDSGGNTQLTVTYDLNQWYTDPHEYKFPQPSFIMDNEELQQKLEDNGATVFSVAS